jgi:hypothetical protein
MMVNEELGIIWKKELQLFLTPREKKVGTPWIRLEGLIKKNTKILSQDSRSPDPDLNQGSPEYEAEMLTTRPDV